MGDKLADDEEATLTLFVSLPLRAPPLIRGVRRMAT
jgi:hypothetical protein